MMGGLFAKLKRRNPEGRDVREDGQHLARSKASKGKPHERNRDGTGPEGCEGSKAPRGCETLRAQQPAGWVPAGFRWLLATERR